MDMSYHFPVDYDSIDDILDIQNYLMKNYYTR